MDCAVTVCDTGGTILYMNDKARTTFARHGDMVGKTSSTATASGRAKSSAACSPTGHECLYDREKRRPQNDLPDSLARGRRRGRTGRNLDGDSRRNAALHPQLIPERRSTRGAGVPRAVLRLRDSKSWISISGLRLRIRNSACSLHPIPDSRGSGCACPGIRDTYGAALRNSAPVNHTAEQNF